MRSAPLPTDLSLYRDWARRVQAGTLPLRADETGDVVETLCAHIEELRAYADLLTQEKAEADARALRWGGRIHHAEGRLPLLWRQVQEVYFKRDKDGELTADEALTAIVRIVELEGAYTSSRSSGLPTRPR